MLLIGVLFCKEILMIPLIVSINFEVPNFNY